MAAPQNVIRRSFLASFVSAFAVLCALFVMPGRAPAQGRPMIEHVEPTSGPPGTRVTIVGRNFRTTARVTFNGGDLPAVESLPERIVVTIPAGARSGRFAVVHGTDAIESEPFTVTAPLPAPSITSIEPSSAAAGAEIVVRGTNFGVRPSDNRVRIGLLPMVVRTAESTALRLVVPEGAASGPVVLRTAGGEAQSPPLTVVQRPTVREFSPMASFPGGHVILRGSGFGTGTPAPAVSVGGRAVRVVRTTPVELEIEIPRDMQRGGTLLVDIAGGGRFETGAALRVSPAPLIRTVEPAQAAPGARVVLRGERFGTDAAAITVTLGGTPARVITAAADAVTVEVPEHPAAYRWNITVAGIGPVELPQDFALLEPVSVRAFAPAAGDPGDHIVIEGSGFSPTPAENTVRLGTLDAQVVSATPGRLEVIVPIGARSGQWTVAVARNGEARAHDPFMVTSRPHIDSIEPPGAIAGSRVVLHGINLPSSVALAQVRLNDLECVVESASREAMTVVIPEDIQPGPARFTVIGRLQGTGRAPMDFQVLVPSRITAVEPPAAPVGATVTVRGEGFETDARLLVVKIGEMTIRPTASTTTSVTFTVPRNAQTGALLVTSTLRQPASVRFVVQYPPQFQNFVPARAAPGSNVSIRGRNFGRDPAAVTVLLGDQPCNVLHVSPGVITAHLPDDARSGRLQVRVNEHGEARAPRDLTIARPPARR